MRSIDQYRPGGYFLVVLAVLGLAGSAVTVSSRSQVPAAAADKVFKAT
jgi:hypothetical protein